jgi:hypothetical protein
MGEGTITTLDPVARSNIKEFPQASRLNSFDGKVLGILWNGKPNGDILLSRIQETIAGRYRLAGTIWQQKPNVDMPGTAAVSKLASNADFIINGQGDWGSCTSWSVHDSIELEKAKKPTATICTDRFYRLAKTLSKSMGMAQLPLIVVPHPIGGLQEEEVLKKADGVIEQIIRVLLVK